MDLFIAEQRAKAFADTTISRTETINADNRGRIETRTVTVIHNVDWRRLHHGCPGLNAIGMVESTRETKGVIENSLHWVMDMIFRDDECRVRTNHAPANFATIKHMAYNLLRRPAGKDSFRLRRKTAGWDDAFLASLVTA